MGSRIIGTLNKNGENSLHIINNMDDDLYVMFEHTGKLCRFISIHSYVSLEYKNEVACISIQKIQMVIDHKSGNGYKKIHKRLNIPLSTVRAIIKKCKTYGMVTNLPGRRCTW